MKRRQGARCWGYEMRDGNAVVCTQIASPHASGNGYVHVLDRPCDCGEDHSAAGHIEPLRKPSEAPQKVTRTHKRHTPLDTFEYRNPDGSLRFRVAKFWSKQRPEDVHAPKSMPQRPDGAGDWIDGLDGAPFTGLLYLPELLAADMCEPVFIPEGEPCAKAIVQAGGVATCNAGGAGCWREEYNENLRGRPVIILRDANTAGSQHAQTVVSNLLPVAASVRMIELEGAHDVADWLADGHTLLELLKLVIATPVLQLASSQPRIQGTNVQDVVHPQPGKPCQQCERLQAELDMANETIQRLNRDFFRLDRIMAQDATKVTAPVKVAAYADVRHMAQARKREDRGEKGPMLHYSREALARRTGVKADTAGRNHNKLVNLKLVTYDKKTEPMVDEQGMPVLDEKGDPRYHTTLFMAEGPLLDEVQLNEHIVAPDNGWGGAGRTKKACPHCGSTHLKPTAYGCENCGMEPIRPEERIDVAVPDDDDGVADVQDDVQDAFTPLAEESDILHVHPMNSGLNHHDERAEVLALVESLGYRTRIPVGIERNVGGTLTNWQTFTAQADNSLIDDALRSLRIRAEAREMEAV